MLAELPPWAVVTEERSAHIGRVLELIDAWAAKLRVGPGEARRWHRAALLHDAVKDADDEALKALVGASDLPRALWHGPAAAELAVRDGERDQGVVDAIRWHTVGYAGWDRAGRALYLADYLEPGRRHDPERAAFVARMPGEAPAVLREVAARRIAWLKKQGHPIHRQTWDFWNGLDAGDSSSW